MPRPSFVIELRMLEPPDVVWARLWDLDRHTVAVPFTRVASVDGHPLAADSEFVARTALGPFGFDDRMVVREWRPTEHAVVEKVGRWLSGTITVDLVRDGDGSRLVWRQSFGARFIPDPAGALVTPMVRAGYRRSLRRILG